MTDDSVPAFHLVTALVGGAGERSEGARPHLLTQIGQVPP